MIINQHKPQIIPTSSSRHRYAIGITLFFATAGYVDRPAAALDIREKYEDSVVQWGLQTAGLQFDPTPQGKQIERIIFIRENIIAPSDPWPLWINKIHIKTHEHIIEQELLIHRGDVWDNDLVDETERILRGSKYDDSHPWQILSVVRLVPARGRDSRHVVLLVITKDLWSLRLNSSFSMTGSIVKSIGIRPTEANLLGRRKAIGVHFRLSQFDLNDFTLRDYWAAGALYRDPRILGTRLAMSHYVVARFNGQLPCSATNPSHKWCDRQAGSLNGISLHLGLSRPLWALSTDWGFSVSASVDTQQVRKFSVTNDRLAITELSVTSPDSKIPWIYDVRLMDATAAFTRSIAHRTQSGRFFKHDISWGLSAYQNHYAPPDSLTLTEVETQTYRQFIPRSETAGAFFVSYTLRPTEYVRLYNIASFALSEDVLLGPSLVVSNRLAADISANGLFFTEPSISAGYRWYIGDQLITLSASAQSRFRPTLPTQHYFADPQTQWVNTQLSASARYVSRNLWIGRLHTYGSITWRKNDLDNSYAELGSDTGLRGYANAQFRGQNVVRFNAEYRTLPINIWTFHAGAVVFYDGGAVFSGVDPTDNTRTIPFIYRQSLGAGLRGVFPQFDRETFRLDFGIPLSSQPGNIGTWITFSLGQVF